MEIIIQPSAEKASDMVARIIAKAIKEKPSLVLGLATGRTMEQLYRSLVRMHREEALDFSLCRSFNLDEYIGLPSDDVHSYRYYMNRHLFSQVNIDLRNTHLPNGMAEDVKTECARYEQAIEACGGVDLQLLGLGSDGHIGFNEPLSALQSRTRAKVLTLATVKQNAVLFEGGEAQVPKRALTMGVGTILEARRIIMLVTGAEKADILAQSVEGPITAMVTATALQLHPKCTVIADEAAAAKLLARDYYRWVFDNEPEWQEFRRS